MTQQQLKKLIIQTENECAKQHANIDATALFNQQKVLNAFIQNRVALRHFAGSTGYSYEDEGKHVLSSVFANAFKAECAIVSPLIASGTHAIAAVLFGLLRPTDTLHAVAGMPYDTLIPVIQGEGNGSLKDFGISFTKTDLLDDGTLDIFGIKAALKAKPKVVFVQRSRGYTWRNSFSIKDMKCVIEHVKRTSPNSIVVVDNCYGEFTDKQEPLEVGADIIVGSLIKNPGGSLAPTGGYICGKKQYIDLIASRLTAPGVGFEVGSNAHGYREYFQGFFIAPHTVSQALKGTILFRTVFSKLGFDVLPHPKTHTISDIICSIRFNDSKKLLQFCQAIQSSSPIDSFAAPAPWDMPGYTDKVVMAAGTFVQGASIELSCDAPMRPPFIAYVQGGLIYNHTRLAVSECAKKVLGL